MIEIMLLVAIGGVFYLYLENRKIKSYLATVEGRLRSLDQKESDEEGALAGTLRDINAHNVILMGLLRGDPEAATFIKEFAQGYPISNEDDAEVMRTVIGLTKKWAEEK